MDCYSTLGVSQTATKREIKDSYRKLARRLHPDRNKAANAEEQFQAIAAAYEALKDEDARADYDYYLQHPEEVMGNMYRYYRKAAPKVDIAPVAIVIVATISVLQYLSQKSQHESARKWIVTDEKHRKKAKKEADSRKLLKGKSKEEKDKIIESIILENVSFEGSHAPADWKTTLAVRIVMLPVTLYEYAYWRIDWWYRIDHLKQGYTDDDRAYLIRKNAGFSQARYDTLEQEDLTELWERECWVKANYDAYKKEKEEAAMAKWKSSARYKRYKRYMRDYEPMNSFE
eukprot:TRINITY_DN4546_c0_g1_i3.p1 TRINITY_DN4546_c0_g1~~TRINITY_DN4546_c0_g1_i3.p1  ORF type:complete len:316 (+),score=63.41 TRINITY_DN4546_c0_g1_i3:89-949(+)